jgi:hypothetical protein
MSYRPNPNLKNDEAVLAKETAGGIRVYEGPKTLTIRKANGGGAYKTYGGVAKNSGVAMNHNDTVLDKRTPGK